VGCRECLSGGSSLKVVKIALEEDFDTTDHIFRLDGELLLKLEIIVSDEF
jgi:hypothetical protein